MKLSRLYAYLLLLMVYCSSISAQDGSTNTNGVLLSNTLDQTANVEEVNRLIPVLRNYYSTKQYDQAEKLCLHLIQLKPNHSGLHELLGLIYVESHHYDKAIPVLQKAFKMGQIDSLGEIIHVYQVTENWPAIRDLIPQMLENKSKDPALIDSLVDYSLRQTPLDRALFFQAVNDLSNDQIIQEHRTQFVLFYYGFQTFGDTNRARQLSLQLNNIKDIEEDKKADAAATLSERECQSIIKQYEQNPQAWNDDNLVTVATVYFKSSQIEKAKVVYGKMLGYNPSDTHAFMGLGNCYLSQTNYEEAIVQYRIAWGLGATNVVQVLAIAYLGSNKDLNRMRDLLPELAKKKSDNMPLILSFSMQAIPPDGQLFMNTIEGITDGELLSQSNLVKIVIQGLEQFGETNRAQSIKNIQLNSTRQP